MIRLIPFLSACVLVLAGCGGGGGAPANNVTASQQTTLANGQLRFEDPPAQGSLEVKVQDLQGNPVSGMIVKMLADNEQVVLLAHDPQGRFLPYAQAHVRQDRGRVIPVAVVIAVTAIGVVSSGISILTHDLPSRSVLDIGNGRRKVCLTGDLQDLVDWLGLFGGIKGILTIKHGTTATRLFMDSVPPEVLSQVLEDYLDRNHTFCWNEDVTIDDRPFVVEVEADAPVLLTDLPVGFTANVTATGRVSGEVAFARLRNTTDSTRRVLLYPGVSFRNGSSSNRQNMTVWYTVAVRLEPGQERNVPVYGACINLSRGIPRSGDLFVPFLDQRADLLSLGQAINRLRPASSIAQQAIWVITDNSRPSQLSQVVRLFEAANLNPSDYAALRGSGPSAPAGKILAFERWQPD